MSAVAQRPSARAGVVGVVAPISQAAGTATTGWIDATTFHNYLALIQAGVLGAALELPGAIVGSRALCYDLSYGQAAIGFLAWARSAGALFAFDGLGMLVETAADAFELWHGHRPDTDPVYAMLRG